MDHGGFGHRPLLLEELIPCISYLRSWCSLSVFFSYFLYGKALALDLSLIFSCNVKCREPLLFALSPKPFSLKTSNLCTQVQVFVKIASVFEIFQVFSVLALQAGISATWAEYLGRPDNPGHSGRIIRLGRAGYIKEGRGGGSSFPLPLGFPSRRRRLPTTTTGVPAALPASPHRCWVSSISGGSSPSHLCYGCGYLSHLLSLGCDVTLLHCLGDLIH
jgi:hypothetical protein